MSDLQSPIINWQVKAGKGKAGVADHRVLIIGHAFGSAAAKKIIEDVQSEEALTLLRAGSHAHAAYRRFRKYNKVTEVDVLPLAVTGNNWVVPKAMLKVVGTATAAGTLKVVCADDEYMFNVSVAKGDTESQIAEKMVNAADAANMEIVAEVTFEKGDATKKGEVTFELESFDPVANGCHVKAINRIPGIVVTDGVFAGGKGALDTAGILGETTSKRYHTIVFDSSVDSEVVSKFLDDRVNSSNAVNGGTGITFRNDTFARLKANSLASNSASLVIIANPNEMRVNAIPLLAAAEFAAKRALRLTDGAILGDIVVDATEAYGGINKASLPYHNTPMSYRAPVNKLTIEQLQDLNKAGASLIVPTGAQTTMGEVVTHYKRDGSGVASSTFKFLNAMDTSFAIQEYLFNNCQKEFAQTRATGGGLVAGVSMTNALSVKAFIMGLYDDLVDMALAQGGGDAKGAFKANLDVTLDAETGKYKIFAPIAIVSQLRGIDGVIAISYNF